MILKCYLTTVKTDFKGIGQNMLTFVCYLSKDDDNAFEDYLIRMRDFIKKGILTVFIISENRQLNYTFNDFYREVGTSVDFVSVGWNLKLHLYFKGNEFVALEDFFRKKFEIHLNDEIPVIYIKKETENEKVLEEY